MKESAMLILSIQHWVLHSTVQFVLVCNPYFDDITLQPGYKWSMLAA